eukprot:s1350_g1.t1
MIFDPRYLGLKAVDASTPSVASVTCPCCHDHQVLP